MGESSYYPLPPTGKGCSRGGVRLEDDRRWGGPSFLSGIAIVLISRAELIEETILLQVSRPLPSALGLKLSNHPCLGQFLACENGIRVDQVQPYMRPQSSTEPCSSVSRPEPHNLLYTPRTLPRSFIFAPHRHSSLCPTALEPTAALPPKDPKTSHSATPALGEGFRWSPR